MEIAGFQVTFLSFLFDFWLFSWLPTRSSGLHVTLAGQDDAADVVHLALVVAKEILKLAHVILQLVQVLSSLAIHVCTTLLKTLKPRVLTGNDPIKVITLYKS